MGDMTQVLSRKGKGQHDSDVSRYGETAVAPGQDMASTQILPGARERSRDDAVARHPDVSTPRDNRAQRGAQRDRAEVVAEIARGAGGKSGPSPY